MRSSELERHVDEAEEGSVEAVGVAVMRIDGLGVSLGAALFDESSGGFLFIYAPFFCWLHFIILYFLVLLLFVECVSGLNEKKMILKLSIGNYSL